MSGGGPRLADLPFVSVSLGITAVHLDPVDIQVGFELYLIALALVELDKLIALAVLIIE